MGMRLQVHPVDALDFQCHLIAQDIRQTPCYAHNRFVWLAPCPLWDTFSTNMDYTAVAVSANGKQRGPPMARPHGLSV